MCICAIVRKSVRTEQRVSILLTSVEAVSEDIRIRSNCDFHPYQAQYWFGID